jgi:hypothetical protein
MVNPALQLILLPLIVCVNAPLVALVLNNALNVQSSARVYVLLTPAFDNVNGQLILALPADVSVALALHINADVPARVVPDPKVILPETVRVVFIVIVPVYPVVVNVKHSPGLPVTGQEAAEPLWNITVSPEPGVSPEDIPAEDVILQLVVLFHAVPTLLKYNVAIRILLFHQL